MRKSGDVPQFKRIIEEIERAKTEWLLGNRGKSERILRLAASIAFAESQEASPNAPVPESIAVLMSSE